MVEGIQQPQHLALLRRCKKAAEKTVGIGAPHMFEQAA
jgi:hypothetical protein